MLCEENVLFVILLTISEMRGVLLRKVRKNL